MIKIAYVGKKADGERAFKELTGITWMPGDVKEVSEEHAKVMLRHGDVFAQAAGEPVKASKDKPKLQLVAADQDEVDDQAIAREEAAKKAAAGEAGAGSTASDTADADKSAEPEKATAKKTAAKSAAKKSAKKK